MELRTNCCTPAALSVPSASPWAVGGSEARLDSPAVLQHALDQEQADGAMRLPAWGDWKDRRGPS